MNDSMKQSGSFSRRQFLATAAGLLLTGAADAEDAPAPPPEPIIDIHQHTNYSFRTDEHLLAHQKAMGVSQTILLPAGSLYGLEVHATGNQAVHDFAKAHPGKYVCFANEVAGLPGARVEIERWLKQGALGIGEQKFQVECDSPAIVEIAEIARDYRVPVLLHFQHNKWQHAL